MINEYEATRRLEALLEHPGETDSKVEKVRELLEVHHACATADAHYPMRLAAENGLTRIGEILLQHGAKVDDDTNFEFQPICIAARKGNAEFCEMLLNNGADVNICDPKFGNTILHIAVYNSLDVCRVLLKRKDINIDCADSAGITPLILAMQSGRWPACRLLLEAGAKTDIVAKNGAAFSTYHPTQLEDMKKQGWILHEGRMLRPSNMTQSLPGTISPKSTQEAVPTQVTELKEIRKRLAEFERPDELGRNNIGGVR